LLKLETNTNNRKNKIKSIYLYAHSSGHDMLSLYSNINKMCFKIFFSI